MNDEKKPDMSNVPTPEPNAPDPQPNIPAPQSPPLKKSSPLDIVAQRLARRNHLAAVYLFIALFLTLSWIIGVLGGSFVWVFMLGLTLYTLWQTRITRLVHMYLQQEETTLQRRRTLKHSESVEWLNFILNRWWVYSSSTIEEGVKKRLDRRLCKVKPSFVERIELAHFELGEQTPFIKSINMFEYEECQPGGYKSVTWSDVMAPPKGLNTMSKYNLVVEAEVGLLCEEFRMVLRSHIGSEKVGVDVDMAVENLNITGKMQIIVQVSMDVPFPHFAKATVYFTEQPDVWFNVRCLKSLQLMELPLIRTWIHTHVMEGLSDALVDPGKMDIHLGARGPGAIVPGAASAKPQAVGVLTVYTTCRAGPKMGDDDVTYINMSMGSSDKDRSREVTGTGQWSHCSSFLVHSLGSDKSDPRARVNRWQYHTSTRELESTDGSTIHVRLDYTPLKPVKTDMTSHNDTAPPTKGMSGVMYINIHAASGLIAGDRDDLSDPYCVVYCDRKKILTTPYVARTRNPTWETEVEFFVSDFTKKTYSLFVYDWDGISMLEDDFLGSAYFTVSADKSTLVREMITLGYNRPSEGYVENKDYGVICVSAVFRHVENVSVSEKYRDLCDEVHDTCAANNNKKVSRTDQVTGFKERLLEDKIFVELGIISARDLVAGDRSGFSDPYTEVMVANKKVFRTAVKKKTLNPTWDETATFYLAKEDKSIELMVYDKDFLGKDFLGSIKLKVEELKAMSLNQTSQWYTLEKTKHGEIQLRCTLMAKDTPTIVVPEIRTSSHGDGDKSPLESTLELSHDHNANIQEMPRKERLESADSFSSNEDKPPAYQQNNLNHSINVMESTPTLKVPPSPGEDLILRNKYSVNDRPIRSVSEMNISNGSKGRRFFSHFGRPRSISARERESPDKTSIASTVSLSPEDAYYNVKGELVQARGLSIAEGGEVYCRIRLDRVKHGHSQLHTLAKSDTVRTFFVTTFNLMFEIDKGHGVPRDALLIVDFKKGKKDTLSSRSYSLREIIRDSKPGSHTKQWLSYDTDIEIEISLTHSEIDKDKLRHRPKLFKSLSFTRKSQTNLNVP